MPEGARSSRGRPASAKKSAQGRTPRPGRVGEPRRNASAGNSRRRVVDGEARRDDAGRGSRRGDDARRGKGGDAEGRTRQGEGRRGDQRRDKPGDKPGNKPIARRGDKRGPRPEPQTEAQKRRDAVRARGGGRARSGEVSAPPERHPETWIDEGPVRRSQVPHDAALRSVAKKAVRRSASGELDPAIRQDLEKSIPARRQAVLADRLRSAQVSLERERFAEAKRVARSLLKEMGSVAAVHEVIGLASYRLGQWKDAAAALEMARNLRFRIEDLPVLADCYRAQKRWQDLDDVWTELKQHSPAQEILSEGRIVYAGSLADRGDLFGAIAVMMRSASAPRRIREHHLRQWYVLADLYDRAGNVQKAREFFRRVSAVDPQFADVESRLAQL